MVCCQTKASLALSRRCLARAFFYAGSRALLVSHWYVDLQAAVALTTGAIAALKADPSSGRAEGLRKAMLALIDKVSGPIRPIGTVRGCW